MGQQIKRQHIEQMQQYYAKIYEGAGDLSDCPQIIKLEKEEEEYEEDQMEANDEEVTDDEEYDDYDNYYDEYEDDDLESTSSSSTTSTTTSYPDPEGNFVIAEPPSTQRRLKVSFLSQKRCKGKDHSKGRQ